jgi:hypothetical protein
MGQLAVIGGASSARTTAVLKRSPVRRPTSLATADDDEALTSLELVLHLQVDTNGLMTATRLASRMRPAMQPSLLFGRVIAIEPTSLRIIALIPLVVVALCVALLCVALLPVIQAVGIVYITYRLARGFIRERRKR